MGLIGCFLALLELGLHKFSFVGIEARLFLYFIELVLALLVLLFQDVVLLVQLLVLVLDVLGLLALVGVLVIEGLELLLKLLVFDGVLVQLLLGLFVQLQHFIVLGLNLSPSILLLSQLLTRKPSALNLLRLIIDTLLEAFAIVFLIFGDIASVLFLDIIALTNRRRVVFLFLVDGGGVSDAAVRVAGH